MTEEQDRARRTLSRIRRILAMQHAEERQRHNCNGDNKCRQGSTQLLCGYTLPEDAIRQSKGARHVLRSLDMVAWRLCINT